MRRDAAVALLADRDGQRDQLFGLLVQRTGGVRGGVHPAVSVIDLGDRATQRTGRFAELLLDIVSVTHDVMVAVGMPSGALAGAGHPSASDREDLGGPSRGSALRSATRRTAVGQSSTIRRAPEGQRATASRTAVACSGEISGHSRTTRPTS